MARDLTTKDVKYIVCIGDAYEPEIHPFTNLQDAKKVWNKKKFEGCGSSIHSANYIAKVIDSTGEEKSHINRI